MNTLVRSNVVAYRRRYIAVLAAITIGVAFLTATLFVGSTMRATLASSIGQEYAHADLVGDLSSDHPAPGAAKDLQRKAKRVPGVKDALVNSRAFGTIKNGSQQTYATINVTDGPVSLYSPDLSKGRTDSGTTITLDQKTAAERGIGIGDEVHLAVQGAHGEKEATFRVIGLTENPQTPDTAGLASIRMTSEGASQAGIEAMPTRLLVSVKPFADTKSISAGLDRAIKDAGLGNEKVRTPEAAVAATVKQFAGGTDALTWILAAFAGIALVVTVLVVANTFSVILAQRTRELALLRVLGARRRQVRSMVTGEATVVGLIGSVAGVLLGTVVVWGGTLIVRLALHLPFATFGFTWLAPIVGLVVGVLVTLLASFRPARAATAVAPLAALRPSDTVTIRSRRGTGRIVVGAILAGLGALMLVLGVQGVIGVGLSFALAFFGGLVSFIGVLMMGTLLIPWAVRQLARPLRGNVAGRLSGLNAVRHPQRTAAIGTALLLGVTLVVMMVVGAQTSRATLDAELAHEFPVDLQVTSQPMDGSGLGATQEAAVRKLPGIRDTAVLPVAAATPACGTSTHATDPSGSKSSAGESANPENQDPCLPAYMADPSTLTSVMTDGARAPRDGMVAAGAGTVTPGADKVQLVGHDGAEVTLPVDPDATAPAGALLITTQTGHRFAQGTLDPAEQARAGGSTLWVKANGRVEAGILLNDVASAAGVSSSDVQGALPIRQAASQIIDTLLMVVSALLAIAVVIALIGVSNTLSLSVIERTRENSLLRALGLTRRQLRRMLALEAALIAGAATVLGVVLGTVYGLAGAQSAMTGFGKIVFAMPWGWIAVVLLVAVGAAVLASVWPARRAAKLSPVEGLAVE